MHSHYEKVRYSVLCGHKGADKKSFAANAEVAASDKRAEHESVQPCGLKHTLAKAGGLHVRE